MTYLHLGALALGPLLMVVILFIVLRRGRKQVVAETAASAAAAAAAPKVVEVADKVAMPKPIVRANKPGAQMAQPITEDPQKVYIREQIQMLGKSNPATVAQLIQTWMDEDRRN